MYVSIPVFPSCDLTNCAIQNDDSCGLLSRVQFTLGAGEEVILFVSGNRPFRVGQYGLTVIFGDDIPYDSEYEYDYEEYDYDYEPGEGCDPNICMNGFCIFDNCTCNSGFDGSTCEIEYVSNGLSLSPTPAHSSS